jgi:hypothetical protein
VNSVRTSGIRNEVREGSGAFFEISLAMVIAAAAYLVALYSLRRGFQRSFPVAIGGCVVAAIAVLPQMPIVSPDTMHFAADVRTLWYEHQYPATREGAPRRQDDPIARQVVVFRNNPSSYGPVTYVVGGLPLPFVGDDLRANVFGQKVLSGSLLVAIAAIAGLLARRIGRNPALVAGMIGLNPLFLLEFAGDGHNDTIMVFFGVLALCFLIQRAWRWRAAGMLGGGLSALSKFALLPAIPIFIAAWFPRLRLFRPARGGEGDVRGGWRLVPVILKSRPLFAAFIASVVPVAFLLFIEMGNRDLGPILGTTENTPYYVTFVALDLEPELRRAMVRAAYVVFFGLTAYIVWRHKLDEPRDVVSAVGLQLGLFLFLFSPTLRHWYQIWAFPFIALSGYRWLKAGAIAFTFGALGNIFVRQWRPSLEDSLGIGHAIEWSVVVMWLITLAVGIAVWRWDQGRGRMGPRESSRAARRRAERSPRGAPA